MVWYIKSRQVLKVALGFICGRTIFYIVWPFKHSHTTISAIDFAETPKETYAMYTRIGLNTPKCIRILSLIMYICIHEYKYFSFQNYSNSIQIHFESIRIIIEYFINVFDYIFDYLNAFYLSFFSFVFYACTAFYLFQNPGLFSYFLVFKWTFYACQFRYSTLFGKFKIDISTTIN